MLTTPAPALPTSRHLTDEPVTRLALAARSGDPAAADSFVRALHRDVWRYVARLADDPRLADDLVQDTFLRALGSLHRFEGRASARPRLSDLEDWQTAAERAQPRHLPGFEDGVALTDLLAALPPDRHRPLPGGPRPRLPGRPPR